MNHLSDANKMVSETPISDSTPHNVADLGMQIRRIERKLNAANVEIEEKRKDVVYLASEKAKLEDCIKRLEDALTSIGEYWNRHTNERAMEDACWHAVNTAAGALEAKEAKL